MSNAANVLRDRLRPTVFRWRRRLDNPEIRNARLLVQRFRESPPEVLHFGASESQYIGPEDIDQRTLPLMISDALHLGTNFYSVAGPSYSPRLMRGYLSTVSELPPPEVLVLGLCTRLALLPWREHPVHGLAKAIAAVDRLDGTIPTWRIRARVPLPKTSEIRTLDAYRYPTLAGDLTIGEYRRRLKDPMASGLDRHETEMLVYSYHHGATIRDDDAWLQGVVDLGAALKARGIRAVPYQMPVPVERGVELFGRRFAELTRSNMQILTDAFIRGYGEVDVVPTGMALRNEHFIDVSDGTEHVNQNGRQIMSDMISSALGGELAR